VQRMVPRSSKYTKLVCKILHSRVGKIALSEVADSTVLSKFAPVSEKPTVLINCPILGTQITITNGMVRRLYQSSRFGRLVLEVASCLFPEISLIEGWSALPSEFAG
jgi:hypothetical protein